MEVSLKVELLEVFKNLNSFIEEENRIAKEEGSMPISPQVIQIVGQTALILAELPFPVTATMDLDVISRLNHAVSKKLSELLLEKGLRLETDGHLIWMPKTTEYATIAEFSYVKVCVAKTEFVVASKFKFKRLKDEKLIKTYLEYFPETREQIRTLSGK